MSHTYAIAANFSSQIKGCAALFQKSVSHARDFHCSNHDSNLALCHSCKDVQEISVNMLPEGNLEYNPSIMGLTSENMSYMKLLH